MTCRSPWLLIILCLWPWTSSWSETDTPQAAAEAGLKRYLAALPPGASALYGIPTGTNYDTIRFGNAFQMAVISPAALDQWTPFTPLNSLTKPTTAWWFPVLVQEKMAALLIVENIAGEWRAVSFGLSDMAKAIHQVETQWADHQEGRPQWILSPQAGQLFYHIPGREANNLTRAFIPAQDGVTTSLTSVQDVIPSIQKAVARNIATFKALGSTREASP
jgi:hypothetical protein